GPGSPLSTPERDGDRRRPPLACPRRRGHGAVGGAADRPRSRPRRLKPVLRADDGAVGAPLSDLRARPPGLRAERAAAPGVRNLRLGRGARRLDGRPRTADGRAPRQLGRLPDRRRGRVPSSNQGLAAGADGADRRPDAVAGERPAPSAGRHPPGVGPDGGRRGGRLPPRRAAPVGGNGAVDGRGPLRRQAPADPPTDARDAGGPRPDRPPALGRAGRAGAAGRPPGGRARCHARRQLQRAGCARRRHPRFPRRGSSRPKARDEWGL
ncbi:MAG: hypothetical protein AVDCRST_MAG19-1909, partial [uncultured Thermomicrobiales bacterium]